MALLDRTGQASTQVLSRTFAHVCKGLSITRNLLDALGRRTGPMRARCSEG